MNGKVVGIALLVVIGVWAWNERRDIKHSTSRGWDRYITGCDVLVLGDRGWRCPVSWAERRAELDRELEWIRSKTAE